MIAKIIDPKIVLQKKINEDKNMDLIYCDEDKWEDSNRVHPFFKPDWSPDLFLSQDYISNLFLIISLFFLLFVSF